MQAGAPTRDTVLAVALWGLAIGSACGSDSEGAETATESSQSAVASDVVATVDGEPVAVDDVVRVARVAKLAPKTAARRLRDELLLAKEARRRGYRDRREVVRARRKALVQALLEREVEERAQAEDISREALKERYRAQADRFRQPERRASVHVLAGLPEDADPELEERARELAARALRELRGSDSRTAVLDRYRQLDSEAADGLDVKVERLPPTARDGSLAEPYLEALFDAPAPAPLEDPVRTRFGWHAIVLTDIQEAKEKPLSAVEEELRREIVTQRRHHRLSSLVRELSESTAIEERSDAVKDVLESVSLSGAKP
jgi:parvulin-like peptidyl-prolyl isomerase